jgi:hypothetical protein
LSRWGEIRPTFGMILAGLARVLRLGAAWCALSALAALSARLSSCGARRWRRRKTECNPMDHNQAGDG